MQSTAATTVRSPNPIPLTDPRALEPTVVGQKAARLARLRRAGFDVPDGMVITASEAVGWPRGADGTVATIRAQLHGALAVRSSAIAEDLAEASFAGMYKTVLEVEEPDDVRRAVGEVVASADGERVASYYGGGTEMAVLVQKLIPAESAGVAFTADPMTGDRDVIVISAVRGLGEALVSGEVDPEEWEFRDGKASCRGAAEVLDEAMAQRVAELAAAVADHDGAPRDIEWALHDGKLWLLQARPITALPRKPDMPELGCGTWMKDSAHLSEPLTPFGASVYVDALAGGMRAAFAEFGLLIEGLDTVVRGGELYGRPRPVGAPPGATGTPPAFLIGLLSRLHPALRARMKAARQSIASGTLESLPRQWIEEHRDAYQSEADRFLADDLDALDDEALLDHLARVREMLQRGQVLHFRLFIPYVVALHELVEGCRTLLSWDQTQAMGLLTGLSVASSAPTRALQGLARAAAASPEIRDSLEHMEGIASLEAIDPAFARAFRAFEHRHGWRTLAYDSGAPTLAERPRLLARLVVDRLEEEQRDPHALRAQAENEARAALAARPDDLRSFERLLAAAQLNYPLREDNIALTDNVPNGLLRRALMAVGRRLVRRGRLSRADDARFLTFDELEPALAGGLTDLRALTERRHAEDRWVRANPGPEVMGPAPAQPPDIRWLPAAGRRINRAVMWAMDQEMTPPRVSDGPVLAGRPGSPGRVRARVRIVRTEADFPSMQPGEVLVCPITSPVWSVLFGNAAALVADAGGAMSHAAIIAREHGIPAVLSTGDGTQRLRDGQWVTVDGTAGTVTLEDA